MRITIQAGRQSLTLALVPQLWRFDFDRTKNGAIYAEFGPLLMAWWRKPRRRDRSSLMIAEEVGYLAHRPMVLMRGVLSDVDGNEIASPGSVRRTRTRRDLDRAVALLWRFRFAAIRDLGEDAFLASILSPRFSTYLIQKEWMARWGIARVSDLEAA